MSVNFPSNGPLVQRPLPQRNHHAAHTNPPPKEEKDTHLSAMNRVGKVALSPLSAAATGLSSGVKASFFTTLTAGTLAVTSHPLLAATVGLGGLVGVPLYALTKALGRLFGNLKAGITGHTPAKQ